MKNVSKFGNALVQDHKADVRVEQPEILRCRYRQASNWASPQTALLERDGESKAESYFLENFYKAVFFLGSIVDNYKYQGKNSTR